MVKFSKDFFKNEEVIFVGYSSRNKGYCSSILKGFNDNKIKVYPYNTKENASFDIKVYKNIDEIPNTAKAAFVLLNKENTAKAVKQLMNKGVKRILFYSKGTVDEATLADCEKTGIATATGCPMMIFGSGLHKLHAFFAGVK